MQHDSKESIITDTTPFGPSGAVVYARTYSRPLPDGSKETYPETSIRVVDGNLALVYGARSTWTEDVWQERDRLLAYFSDFSIVPAGRHLWATGVKDRQFLFNCHVAPWGSKLSDHFEFTFMRLMEGGGVGANYSTRFLEPYGAPRRGLTVHIVCDPDHQDYAEMLNAGLLSKEFDSDWSGAFDVEDSREGWAGALVDLMDTAMTDDEVEHENRVYDVSRVRRKGARLKTFGGTASGPAPFASMLLGIADVLNDEFINAQMDEAGISPISAMDIDHAIASCVVAGGARRSARMAGVHWRDPAIFDFINCKQDKSKNWTTNISVIIDEDFLDLLNIAPKMSEMLDDLEFEDWSNAQRVHNAAVKGMLTNGEPGYWNYDLSNEGEVNEVVITNPCGEIALPERGACVLGHVNLDAFAPNTMNGPVDGPGLVEAHRLMTRFLIRATYGDMSDAGQAAVMQSERRIGVGHFGVQGFLAKCGISYSTAPRNKVVRDLLAGMKAVVREEARNYAFHLRIPEPVKVTTVAPTGSVAKLPGATEGIHPVLFRYFIQRIRFSATNPEQLAQVEPFRQKGLTVEVDQYDASGDTLIVCFPTEHLLVAQVVEMGYSAELVETASEISLENMLDFQEMYQTEYADNAVSFTVNMAAEPHQLAGMLANPFGDVLPPSTERVTYVAGVLAKRLYRLKGTTLMIDGSRPQAPYEEITKEQYDQATFVLEGDGIDEDCSTGACPIR